MSLTRWQRFKHAFVACRGPEVAPREYRPPLREKFEVRGLGVEEFIDEALNGVTLFHHQCRVCDKRYTNRSLGDWREADKAP